MDLLAIAQITTAIEGISSSAGQIQTAVLTILGVLVTIGIAYSIVKGLQK